MNGKVAPPSAHAPPPPPGSKPASYRLYPRPMTLEIGFLFLLLAVMVYFFLSEKLSVELTAFCGLVALIFTGFVAPQDAFVGFSSPAVITMFSIFFISAALARTGVADVVGKQLAYLSGGREIPLVTLLMLLAGGLSAFMNNVAAAAVLMPAVSAVSGRTGISPSRLFMPLAFGAILGGTITLVGTPPNILTGEVMAQQGLVPFDLFDFSPMGVTLLGVGILFMILVGLPMLPARLDAKDADRSSHLTRAYRIDENLTSIRIAQGSPLEDRTLVDTQLSSALGVSVLGVRRDGRKILAPGPDFVLKAEDWLMVDGRFSDLEALLAVRGVGVGEAEPGHLEQVTAQVHGVVLRLPKGSGLIGRSLKQLHFRDRFHVLVVGIRRGKDRLRQQLGRRVLRATDEILVLADDDRIAELNEQKSLEVVAEVPFSELMPERIFVLKVAPDSPLTGRTIRQSRLGELAGLTVVGIVRQGKTSLAVPGDTQIENDDELLLAGEPDRLWELDQIGPLDLSNSAELRRLESRTVGTVEAVVAPRSTLVKRTLAELNFRRRFGLHALAIWRSGEALHAVTDTPLQVGDALLLYGPRRLIDGLGDLDDFVILDQDAEPVRRYGKAPAAIGALLAMVGIVVSGIFPIHVAAFTGAVITVLFGALTMDEAYRAIEWRALFLVAAILPVGGAIESSGAARLMAEGVAQIGQSYGPHAFLAALVVLASILSQTLDGAPTVVILAPVVVLTAEKLGLSPYPFLMAVGLAASAAFMTPFSQKASLLVMGAGGYRTQDFLKVGTPLTLIVLVLLVLLIPVFFPF